MESAKDRKLMQVITEQAVETARTTEKQSKQISIESLQKTGKTIKHKLIIKHAIKCTNYGKMMLAILKEAIWKTGKQSKQS